MKKWTTLIIILTILPCLPFAFGRGQHREADIRLVFFVDQGTVDAWSAKGVRPDGVTKREWAQHQIMKVIKANKTHHRRRVAADAVIEDVNDIRIGQ